MNIELEVPKLHFDALDKSFNDPNKRYLVSCGGSRSAKTWSVSIYFILLALESDKEDLAVCRYEQTTVRRTVFKDYCEIVALMDLSDQEVVINKSEMIMRFPQTGSEIKFLGLNSPEKIKGLRSTHAHIDEALDSPMASIDQLDMRCSGKIVFTYNPTVSQHPIIDNIAHLGKTVYLHSTWRDNRWLSQPIIDKIKSYNPEVAENVENGTADEYMYKVFDLGVPAGLPDRIYKHFKIVDSVQLFPKLGTVTYGIDFGFGHAMAIVKGIHFDDKFYLQTILYESGLTINSIDPEDTGTLLGRMAELNIPKDAMIIADSARPEAIESLRRAGFSCFPCRKGAGSVLAGIEIVKSQTVYVPLGDHILIEAEKYRYKTDNNGTVTQPVKPIKKDDESLDALRYLITSVVGNAVAHNSNSISRGNSILSRRDGRPTRRNYARR